MQQHCNQSGWHLLCPLGNYCHNPPALVDFIPLVRPLYPWRQKTKKKETTGAASLKLSVANNYVHKYIQINRIQNRSMHNQMSFLTFFADDERLNDVHH